MRVSKNAKGFWENEQGERFNGNVIKDLKPGDIAERTERGKIIREEVKEKKQLENGYTVVVSHESEV